MRNVSVLVIHPDVMVRRQIALIIEKIEWTSVAHFSPNLELGTEWLKYNSADVIIISSLDKKLITEEFRMCFRQVCPNSKIILLVEDTSKNLLRTDEFNHINIEIAPIQSIYDESIGSIIKALKYSEDKNNEGKETIKKEFKSNGNLKFSKAIRPSIITISSSTGGPVALEHLFANLNFTNRIPILIVQHMPPLFTETLANSLSKKSAFTIVEGKDGMQVSSSGVYIAPGGFHTRIENINGMKTIKLSNAPAVNGVRPAADVMMESIANNFFGLEILNIILTGMGCDGTRGTQIMKERCSVHTICQDEESSLVFGMPGSAIANNLADEVMHLSKIPHRINSIINKEVGDIRG